MSVEELMMDMGRRARAAANVLRASPAEQRSEAIRAMARMLRSIVPDVLAANAADVADATVMIDRLRLDEARLEGIAKALEQVAGLPDPVGTEIARWERPNGLDIARVRTPIGVIGMIFESRPNVGPDAGSICLRSGNAVILRSGSDALRSVMAIHRAVEAGLADAGLPADAIQLVPTSDRDAVGHLLGGLGGTVDLIIPRGGKALVGRVEQEARVPVLAHLEGLCHTYVHAATDPDKAEAILVNAKMRRVSVCGSTETLLIDQAVALDLLPRLAGALIAAGCVLRGDDLARQIVPNMEPATEADWTTEYLAPILSVRVVAGYDHAIEHIADYGSAHTEAIVTEDTRVAEAFLRDVDSAIVMHNASTQFADGGEFGFGAEIGIATGRLHARGPVGPEQLTTFKYQVRGTGQTRP